MYPILKAAGHYQTNVLVSLAAGAGEVASLNVPIEFGVGENKAKYMQDVDKAFCDKLPTVSNSNEIIEGRLEDKRDGKIYWVAKLQDNLCWMTQNLDLDLTTNGLTAELTDLNTKINDVIVDWNKDSATQSPSRTVPADTLVVGELNTTSWPNSGPDEVRSYDPGLAIFTKGTTRKELTDKRWEMGQDFWLTVTEAGGDDTWTVTYDKDFVAATSYDSADGKMVCSKKANTMLGDMTSTYIPCRIYYYEYLKASVFYGVTLEDLHWSQGNYYSFNAATAGSGKNKTTDDKNGSDPATDSICPKGWKLPLSGTSNGLSASAKLGSFGLMLNKQNATSSATIRTNPLYYLYGGHAGNGLLNSAGGNGYYWSSTSVSTTNAYSLDFHNNGILPSYSLNRYLGFSVRCVAR